MSNVWFCSDHHLGHKNILNFLDKNGNRIRPFSDVNEHDEIIIANHNKLVGIYDKVYFLGDVAINKQALSKVARFNGKKILIKGNHDIFDLSDYAPYFKDIRAYKVYSKLGIVCSHIPLHTECMYRWRLNIHGHLHQNIINDPRYLNVCLEQTGFKPINLEEILKKL